MIAGQIVEKYVEMLKSSALVIALQGELGTGKTEFAKGVGKALDVEEPIVSPTYQIMNEYAYKCGKVSGKMVHIDTWRLEHMTGLEDLAVDKYIQPGNVLVIEWLEKVRDWLETIVDEAILVWVTIEGLGDKPRHIRVKQR
jgi:tRNA threonylcarbamoyladenosine biosynthesis protein TsaE